MRQVAHRGIDRLNAGSPIDRALADIAARVHSQAKEDRRAARPLIEQLAREIVAEQHRSRQPRRLGNPVVATAAGTSPASAAAAAIPDSTRPGAGTADV